MISSARRVADFEIFLLAPAILILALPASLPKIFGGLALIWIALLWLCRFIARGYLSVATPVDLPILFLWLLLPLNLYASADAELSRASLFRFIGETAILYAVVNWAADTPNRAARVRLLSVGLVAVGTGVTLLGLLATNLSAGKVLNFDILNRLPHLIVPLVNPLGVNANFTGGLAAVLLPLAVAQLLWTKEPLPRIIGLVGALALGATTLITQSRGAWLGVALALVVMTLFNFRRAWLSLFILIPALVIALNFFGVERFLDFVAGGGTIESGAGRLEIWERALYMLQDFPFTGVGIGTFGKVASVLYPFFTIAPDTQVPHAHNIYLQAGVDHGIPGMVALIGFLTALFVTGLISIRRAQDTPWRGLAVGLFGALVVYLAHGMFDAIDNTLKTSALIYASFGLLIATARCVMPFDISAQTTESFHAQTLPSSHSGNVAARRWRALLAAFKRPSFQTAMLWALVSLLAIGVVGNGVFWGLALVILGGLAVGLQGTLIFFRRAPDLEQSFKL
ncbi:MAG: hypothetical protein BroJett039_11230 [Chloroflexota bacterium]|nr:MAG: hypothetical protein BroJett039_11230 [Chloroflexota bacterium]